MELKSHVNFNSFLSLVEQKLTEDDIKRYKRYCKCRIKPYENFQDFVVYFISQIENERTQRVFEAVLFKDQTVKGKHRVSGRKGLTSLQKLELSVSTLKNYLEDESWQYDNSDMDQFNRQRFYENVLKSLMEVKTQYGLS